MRGLLLWPKGEDPAHVTPRAAFLGRYDSDHYRSSTLTTDIALITYLSSSMKPASKSRINRLYELLLKEVRVQNGLDSRYVLSCRNHDHATQL